MEKLISILCDSIEIMAPLICILLIIKIVNGIINIWDYYEMKKSCFDISKEFEGLADEILEDSKYKGKHHKEEN